MADRKEKDRKDKELRPINPALAKLATPEAPVSPLSRPAPWGDLDIDYCRDQRADSVYSANSYAPSVRSARTSSSGFSLLRSSASSISGESVFSRLSIDAAGPDEFYAAESMGVAIPLRQDSRLSAAPALASIAENKRDIAQDLGVVAADCRSVLEQVGHQMMDLSKAASSLTQTIRLAAVACAKALGTPTSSSSSSTSSLPPPLSPVTSPALASILKVVLHFADNLLVGLPYASARSLLLRATAELGIVLRLMPSYSPALAPPQPHNFAISAEFEKPETPAKLALDKLAQLMAVLPQHQVFSEHDGAFVAPIARGFSESFSIVSVLFGVPSPTTSDHDSVSALWDVADDIHFFCQRNRILVAAGKVSMAGFRAPFRNSAAEVPPMSMSIATEDAETLSGTLGGYVYPKVDPNDPALAAYSQSAFAMTCAHVCLTEAKIRRPPVSVPSPVLVNMYRDTLLKEYARYAPHSDERRAFKRAVNALDAQYPRQNGRSVPPKFGDVLWGERTLANGMISDVAIVRCRPGLKPEDNELGDDVPFAEFDPSLMFTNLSVRRVVKRLVPGLEVFKYGSTSKFTTGKLNGPRLIYWADGALQSSEFVVAAAPSGMFATGGDSGAWILRKDGISGLGVVGMLHAYDGEHREFGLFTPMTRILDRLRDVTGIEWGVVGAKDVEGSEEEEMMVGGSETSDSSRGFDGSLADSSSDSELE
ncbi:peptidase family S64-domain-containing protein [Myxozyma melibiosi]|uniref:Peptidase family S64-domain-containing protein n=1 Tax=Myxozyma melibiosi TaxID=54550 RepID=A0ABR1EXY9_9ASCO